MAEEFQESDVVFSDYYDHDDDYHQEKKMKKMKMKMKMKKSSSSNSNTVPVDINIPVNLFHYVGSTEKFEEEYQDGEITPPHVIVGRRLFAEKMAFSVCSGNGRTLKGRDLSRVRNSILRMTGFLET
ncbi:hypothetical protein EZV62_027049 [Acer yangbiense]|uniref:Senescence regulator S40 n=1 Tax=Acer yangbiense TaxID=1000413 RepID=A0A5C7GT45_9ROSI|nr:hypothetical protein EZV62_027049 [Acer yangbiense]